MKSFLSHKQTVSGLLLMSLIVVLVIFLFAEGLIKSEAAEKKEVFAAINNCISVEKRNSCFKALSEEFIKKEKLETVFTLLEENQQTPKIFEACHVLLHFLGQEAYKKFGDISETLSQGNYVCFAGFYHGALEGYFIENDLLVSSDEDLVALREKIPDICVEANVETQRDYFECLHGLGHGLMFATDGELPQALALCDALEKEGEATWCYSGVFMENSTSTTNPDHPSKYIKESDPFYPCNILEDKYLNTCYILQSMYITHKVKANWPEVASFCMKVPATHRSACFDGIGQSLAGFSPDPKVVRDNCLAITSIYQRECISGAVGAIGEKYKPPFPIIVNLCSVFDNDEKIFCYETAFRSMPRWSRDKDELREFCELSGEEYLETSCLNHIP